MREDAEYWWSEERHKVEIAEAYRKGWEDAKEECALVAQFSPWRGGESIAAAIRALKDQHD